MPPRRATRNGTRKSNRITIEKKKDIVLRHESGVRVSQLANHYGLAKSTICTILKKKEVIKATHVVGTTAKKEKGNQSPTWQQAKDDDKREKDTTAKDVEGQIRFVCPNRSNRSTQFVDEFLKFVRSNGYYDENLSSKTIIPSVRGEEPEEHLTVDDGSTNDGSFIAEINDVCRKWTEVEEFVRRYHPNRTAVKRAVSVVNDCVMSHFREMVRRGGKKSKQSKT